MIKSILCNLLILTLFLTPAIGREFTTEPFVPTLENSDRNWFNMQAFDGNEWWAAITNDGSWCTHQYLGASGGRWPRATATSAIYNSGLWIGATVNSDVRVSAVQYGSEFSPGPITSPGVPADPWDWAYRTYKLNRWHSAGHPDWDEWPATLGAPVDGIGNPWLPMDQTLFSIYNDLSEDHIFPSAPLEAEVRQTIIGGVTDVDNGLNRTFFVQYEIINRSSDNWNDAYFSIWSDPDIDDATNDYVGIDTTLDLAYVYSAASGDPTYSNPPAIGYQLLEDSFEGGLTAYVIWTIDIPEPSSVEEAYNYQHGLNIDGSDIIDPGLGTASPYMYPGDPVTGTGWTDPDSADERLLMTVGGETVTADDTVTFTIAITIAQGTDNLNSITELLVDAAEAKAFWEADFAGVTTVDRPILISEQLLSGFHLPPVEPGQTTSGILELMNSGNQTLTGSLEFPAGSGYFASPTSFSITADMTEAITISFTAPDVQPATRFVPDEYATIQAAIDASQLTMFNELMDIPSNDPYAGQEHNTTVNATMDFPGDLIRVDPGTYQENLAIDQRTIHLEAQGTAEETVIDGNAIGSCLTFNNSPNSSVMGFSIKNGSARTGGGIFISDSWFEISNNHFNNNYADYGGAIYASGNGLIHHNQMFDNSADWGGAARLNQGGIDFINNTLWNNSAITDGDALYLRSSGHRIINNIIWPAGSNAGIKVNYADNPPLIEFCDIAGGWLGEGNIDIDPLFVDAAGGDFYLQAGSPCIDAGHPDLNGNGVPWHADPEDRDPDNTRLDLGAIFRPSGTLVPSPPRFAELFHRDHLPGEISFQLENWSDQPVTYDLELVSPDSTWVVYADEPDPSTYNGNIWIMRPDGSEKTQLTFDVLDRDPVWSPDGQQILFWSNRDGDANIWVMNADGTNPHHLTVDPNYDVSPSWSPDGQSIIFVSGRDHANGEIYRMDADGNNIQRLTFNELNDRTPKYSPDGQYFATSSSLLNDYRNIHIYNADGSAYTSFGNPVGYDYQPAWSPDGKRVLWSGGIDAQERNILSANMDGSELRLEFGLPGQMYYPRYSPDGQYLSFAKSTYYPSGGDEIYIWHRNFRRLIQLSDATPITREWGPDWSPLMGTPVWLWLDHDNNTVEPGEASTVIVGLDLYGLPVGIHNATILVRDNATGGIMNMIPISIRLTETYGPEIVEISDVPLDQGGYVHIRFLKSLYDTNPVERNTEFYTLWRRLPTGQWEGLASIGAVNQFENLILGTTLQDATDFYYTETEFMLTAHLDEGTFASESAWGASWDNLAPLPPVNISFTVDAGIVHLAWDPSEADDFLSYLVYRGETPDFDPTQGDEPATAFLNSFSDALPAEGNYYYRVSTVDVHGNESDYSEVVEVVYLGTDEPANLPTEFALHQNYPNPFNPNTVIRYDLPEAASVTITITDLLGREIRQLIARKMEPGWKSVTWDATDAAGKPVGAGVYFYQIKVHDPDAIEAGEYVQTRKMLLLK
ncbi:MAG: PD40 domain-containing protein [Candidatus Marinimicrobia bacterium]|nr:PD40 domain-containing protein [Candidatus Neomarinimicrobiota bacterium]